MRCKANLKVTIAALAVLGLACQPAGPGTDESQATGPSLETDEQKTLYALGLAMSQNLKAFTLRPDELEIVFSGLRDGLSEAEPKLALQEWAPRIRGLQQARMQVVVVEEKAAGAELAAQAAAEPGAVVTDSGLVYLELRPGDGGQPKPTDTVKVHYEGRLRDGVVFDSSVARGTPAQFALNRVVQCWNEAVPMLKVGGKARLICPSDIAYGDRGTARIPPGATLIFEVELLEIVATE